jgi:hypothetical protein
VELSVATLSSGIGNSVSNAGSPNSVHEGLSSPDCARLAPLDSTRAAAVTVVASRVDRRSLLEPEGFERPVTGRVMVISWRDTGGQPATLALKSAEALSAPPSSSTHGADVKPA